MRRRVFTLMMAMLMVFSILPAWAEENSYAALQDAVYRIVLRQDGQEITLGSGVLFDQQNVLLTAESCCREGELVAIGEDGEHPIMACTPLEDTGAAMMQMLTPSAAQPLELAVYDAQSLPCILGTDAEGMMGIAPLYHVLHAMYKGQKALQLVGSEGLLPGAVVVDENSRIIALTVTQHMEGVGRYIALEPEVLSAATYHDKAAEAFLPVEITWTGGMLNIAWQDALRSSGMYLISLTSEANAYYTSFEAGPKDRSLAIAVPAGHTYQVQVQWAETPQQAIPLTWSAMASFTVPEIPFTQHGFRQECYLASAPAGADIDRLLEEMPFITVDALSYSKNTVYLQVISAYDVTDPVELPMTVSLIAPDGQFYFADMIHRLSPEKEASDTFVVPVDDLFASCRDFSGMGTMPAGDYVIRCTIGGKIAGEYAFTVQATGTPAPAPTEVPAPAESGFLHDISVTHEAGLITVDWADCAVPQGKKVTAYVLYEGNTYYTFNEPMEGLTSVTFPSIPGVSCMVWAAYADEGHPQMVPDSPAQCVILEAAPAEAFALHGFANIRSGVAVSEDPDAAQKAEYLPEASLTRDLLTGSSHVYFQTEDTYAVTEESGDHILIVALHTPEGMHFLTAGGYTFAPEFSSSDLWLLEITQLLRDYEQMVHTEPWPAGEYTVGYYIDGQVAAEIVFTLE